MSLNSDALRLFLGVVDAGSLSAAAEVLGHTASGVSRGLSRLEEDLGVTLLNRTTRRMELTEEGKHFLPKARQIVASLEEAEECMRMVHQRPAGRLRGPMVVSMRPVPPEHLSAAIRESSLLPAVHGGPVHCGDPSGLGIDDLGRPDFGEPVDFEPDDIPVFWACGVTPQAAVMASRPPFAITHAPGQMFLSDARDEQFRVA